MQELLVQPDVQIDVQIDRLMLKKLSVLYYPYVYSV